MSSRDDFSRLVEPPVGKWALPSLEEIVQGYGTALPADYLWLMETYGPGEISSYLSILPPIPASDIGKVPGVCPTAAQPEEGVEGIEPGYLKFGGLLALGYTPDGDGMFWSTTGAPDEWPVVVFRRHHPPLEAAWNRYDCGIVEFLVRVFTGRLERNPFSGDDLWRNESPSFARPAHAVGRGR